MIYKVLLDFDIDEDVVRTYEEVEELVKEIFNYSDLSAFNVEVVCDPR